MTQEKQLEAPDIHVLDSDEIANDGLHQLGYQPELLRNRGFSHIFSMTVTCLAVPYGLGSAMYTAIIGGGPATLVWGSVIITFFSWTMAYSLAELSSRYPTSAGPYASMAQTRPVVPLWMDGQVLIATLMASLSVAFGLAQHIIATVNIVHPDFAPAQWVYILIAYALLGLAITPVFLSPRLLTILDQANFVWTWAYKVIYIIVLSVRAASGRRTAKYAFTHYEPGFSGWGSVWTFFIGLLPAAYANCSIGMVVAVAEEVHRPEINVPRAMVWTMPCSLILAWAFILPLTFTLPDMDQLLEAPGGIVIPHAFKLIIGNDAGAIIMMVGLLGIGFFCLIAINTSASRLLWSFSRDRAVPWSRIWSRVTPSGNIPASIALCVAIQMLVCLVDLGSSLAFNAFVGAAIIAFTWSYLIPVVFSLLQGRREVNAAPFGHPVLGLFCNWIFIAYCLLGSVLFSMPIALPLTAVSMNYASVVLVGLMAIAAVWYGVGGRRKYKGPPEVAGIEPQAGGNVP